MAKNKSMLNNIKNRIVCFFLIAFYFGSFMPANAQDFPAWYLVSFNNKNNSSYQLNKPQEFLSEAAIYRRLKNDVAIDSTDLPVNKNYIDSLTNINLDVYHISKWINAALVKVDSQSQISTISNISIVDSLAYMAPYIAPNKNSQSYSLSSNLSSNSDNIDDDYFKYSLTKSRIQMVNLDPLLNSNSGAGVNVAVFDNGFLNVDKLDAFAHLFQKGNVKYTYNFTNDNKSVYNSGSHGTAVLSCMAAIVEDNIIGSAIAANYFLFQTEDNRYEFPIEEVNWLFAAEKADSLGVDIITSSLVYYTFDNSTLDHNHSQLDGETAIISRAANMASQKGIIVFNSAGNEGNGPWRKICFPSDAKDIITVGAVDKEGIIAEFSSVGYTADNRVKPDICAEGEATPVISSNGEISMADGTSFSTPFAAGAMATLMAILPNVNYNDLRKTLIQSADQYSNPDSFKGYGIPDYYFASILLKQNIYRDQIKNDKFSVLPNPFHTNFYILFSSTDSVNVDIIIYDMSGKRVYQVENYQCLKGNNLISVDNISSLHAGVYVVELTAGEEHFTHKVIKE